jgi:hypothetical protein
MRDAITLAAFVGLLATHVLIERAIDRLAQRLNEVAR